MITNREEIARIIDPYAFRPDALMDRHDQAYQARALAKADRILAGASAATNVVTIPPLTDDQRAYLDNVLRPQLVDMTVVIGGPRSKTKAGT